MNPFVILTRLGLFAGTAAIGAAITFTATALMGQEGPQSTATEAPEYILTGAPDSPDEAVLAAFDIVPGDGEPLPTIEPAQLLLVAGDDPPEVIGSSGLPRVPPVSQFDGGPFQGANCTLAAGSMLARLGWGIVTNGSLLRTLQDDQDGGTGLDDLATALWRGYGVSPAWGGIRPEQLRALIGSGYGAVIQGVYSHVVPPFSLQTSFGGPHAVYIDAYFPGSAKTPPAYYVVDPLFKPASGHRGAWWPASLVEQFGLAFGPPGRILAAWTYQAGGAPPVIPDIGYLPTGGEPAPAPDATPNPAATPEPLPEEPGDVEPPSPPSDPVLDGPPMLGDVTLDPVFHVCLLKPTPPGCPKGIPGKYGVDIGFTPGKLIPSIDIRFVDTAKPSEVLVGFVVDPSGPAEVSYWKAGTSGSLQKATAYHAWAAPDGTVVRVARLPVLAATAYNFQVTATGLLGPKSKVGSFTTTGGIKLWGIDIAVVSRPVLGLDDGFSLYTRLATDALAPPVLPCPGGAGPIVLLGGVEHCLAAADPPPVDACLRATIDYELLGLGGDAAAIRAVPAVPSRLPDGGLAEETTLEVLGPPGGGQVEVGCLTPGIEYRFMLDLVGDARGPLFVESLAVPGS